jgi:hypothetical protein
MKIRNGFVSNSSSSSFVILKDSLTEEQYNMIIKYKEWVIFFIDLDEKNWIDKDGNSIPSDYEQENRLLNDFSYLDSIWNIVEYDYFVFGETPMDNFDMYKFFDYIKIDRKSIEWGEYNDTPDTTQLEFINKKRQEYRKIKLDKLNESR